MRKKNANFFIQYTRLTEYKLQFNTKAHLLHEQFKTLNTIANKKEQLAELTGGCL